jgi:hypothetical protein
MATMKKYRMTPEAQRIVDETTPNPTWDEYGHLFLMIEEHGPMQLSDLLGYVKRYNEEQNATMPTDPVVVREGLGMLINCGMLEAVED